MRNTKDKAKAKAKAEATVMKVDLSLHSGRHSFPVSVLVMSWLLAAVGVATTADAWAAEKPNSCGCYQDASGSCFCSKKARCGCPGSCEPKGCEEKRAKEINREIEAETRKAQNAASRQGPHGDGDRQPAASDDSRPDREPAHDRKAKPPHLTPAQRKQLARLLELYAAEHTDRGSRTVEQVRTELSSAPLP